MADSQAGARGSPEPHAEALVESVRVNGSAAEATLSGTELAWRPTSAVRDTGGRLKLELESDVLGFQVEGRALKVSTFSSGDQAAAAPLGCGGGGRDRRRWEVVFEMENEEAAERWGDTMRDRFAALGRPKRLFIIVNPYGGNRDGRRVFQTEVLPLIEAAGIHYIMQETKHCLHAQEIAQSLDVKKYDGIVCVSGDGILVEVVNGLLQRDDWDKAIKVPLGIIPAGTGNGMVQALLHSAGEPFSMSNAVFAIIRGHKRALDVTSVVQGKTKFFSVMMLTWGLIADIDIESEKFRWMGSARIDFYSLLRVLNLRRYNGRILFVPAPGYENFGDPVEKTTSSKSNGASNAMEGDISNVCNDETCTYSGPSVAEVDLEWRSLNGPFVNAWISNIAFASEGVMIAPQAQFADGYLDAAIIKDCPRSAALGLLLRMKDGSYIDSPYVEYFKMNGNLTIGKAMRWWEKGTQPNMREIESAQDLADSLRDAGDKLVIVDFFSPGCGGCRALHPKIAQFAERNPDVLFLQVNYEQHKSMCYSLHVHVLPFFRFYRGAQGRVSSFSCTNATIKKFKDALAKHSPDRCSLGPARGLEESELLALATNRDLQFTYSQKPSLVPIAETIKMEAAAIGGPWLPLPPSATQFLTQGSDNSLIPSGR